MSDAQAAANLDSLLDMNLDDLEDMPSFEAYPDGAHQVQIFMESKVVNEHPSIELKMVAIATVELANPEEDKPLEPKAETSILFMLDNEFGQGSLKEVLKPLAQHFGVSQVAALIEASKGAECLVVTKKRWNKDKTQAFTSIKSIQVV